MDKFEKFVMPAEGMVPQQSSEGFAKYLYHLFFKTVWRIYFSLFCAWSMVSYGFCLFHRVYHPLPMEEEILPGQDRGRVDMNSLSNLIF